MYLKSYNYNHYFVLTTKINQLMIKLVTLGKIFDVIFYKLEIITTYFKVQ